MSGVREAELLEGANLLLDSRRTKRPIEDLPLKLRPETLAEAEYIQNAIAAAHGGVGGWKAGAGKDGGLSMAPMPSGWIAPGGSLLRGSMHRLCGVEAEIGFLLGRDLPVTASGYTREQVMAAAASCHAAIEVGESALLDPAQAAALTRVADLQLNGGFIYGPACLTWRTVNFSQERVALAVAGIIRSEKVGPAPGSDPVEILRRLASEGAARTGGLRAGQWITTGSWTGCETADAGATVDVQFGSVGRVTVSFEQAAMAAAVRSGVDK